MRSVFRKAPSSIPLGYIGFASLARNIDPQIAVASEFPAVLLPGSSRNLLDWTKTMERMRREGCQWAGESSSVRSALNRLGNARSFAGGGAPA